MRAESFKTADEVIIVTCMIRQSAEDRVVGLVRNLTLEKKRGKNRKIIVTGCMSGMALRDKSGKLLKALRKRMPGVDEFLPIEEIGLTSLQVRTDKTHALVTISNGCNNFCSYCVVPYSRGKEVSRPVEEILNECNMLASGGYTSITLLGQNVNSYGADLFSQKKWGKDGKVIKPVMVKHLGKLRIPTLFPYLLEEVCSIDGIKRVDFLSSNPWDFSDELIDVIARNPKIAREIHLPVQSGDDDVLKKMNRWYTAGEYLRLITTIRKKVPGVTFSTDIIVGFPGESEVQFSHTVELCKKVGFFKAYVAMYSDRPMTQAHQNLSDALPYREKKKRWGILENLINKKNKRSIRSKKKSGIL